VGSDGIRSSAIMTAAWAPGFLRSAIPHSGQTRVRKRNDWRPQPKVSVSVVADLLDAEIKGKEEET
jgi:hypothetical protein